MKLDETGFTIVQQKPLPKEELYIGARTAVGDVSLATKKITLLVCGYETISLPMGGQVEDHDHKAEDGEFTEDFSDKFTTNGKDCPIESLALFKDKEGKHPYTNNFVKMN